MRFSPLRPLLSPLAVFAATALHAQQINLVDAPPTDTVSTIAGFKVERIYTVAKDEGSWVAMTIDDKGRMITSDQYGGLFRVTLPSLGESKVTKVEHLDSLGLGGAHGLLYTHGSLYVMVNENKSNHFGAGKSGLHRLRDTDGDDKYDHAELLREMEASGEHGPHALVLGPDQRTIYYMNGNYTKLPVGMEKQIPVAYKEDLLLPRMWPPVGSGRGILAPAGNAGRTDLDGKSYELFAMGFRNSYRLTFDPNGEIFAFDSDTENENGTPWYLPTRVIHVVSGGDYGWRSGSGRWPVGFPDSLPAMADTGPGSPTGVIMGTGAHFPAKYQHALFTADWTFGTLYAYHLAPDGATFKGTKEEFVWGKPLPLTDVMINPNDGAMYFTAGGRMTDSALYRVTYIGKESTAASAYPKPTPEALLRRKLEALHTNGSGQEVVDQAWPYLSHSDRFIRWAARVAIERQPVSLWAERALAEKNRQGSLEALVALVRLGDKSLQPRIIEAISKIYLAELPLDQQHALVRLWQLTFTRMGEPSPAVKARVAALLDPFYPHNDRLLSRDLGALLVYLDSPTVVAKTVPLLTIPEHPEAQDVVDETLVSRNSRYGPTIAGINKTRPARQQFAYATILRSARVGWTPALHEQYFTWFNEAYHWTGGLSFNGFINNIRMIALAAVPDPTERARLAKLSERPQKALLADVVPAKGPGKAYTVDEALTAVKGHLTGRNYQQGRNLFGAAACVACHRLGNQGLGTAGPILTQAGSRYSERDLLQSIIEPSASINENFAATRYELKDGSTLIGYPTFEENGELFVTANLMVPNSLTLVKAADVKTSRMSEMSLMPPGLINGLNEEELRDLVAFILSGGDRDNAMFAPAK
jgi:putative heme-binding domain-containing protein